MLWLDKMPATYTLSIVQHGFSTKIPLNCYFAVIELLTCQRGQTHNFISVTESCYTNEASLTWSASTVNPQWEFIFCLICITTCADIVFLVVVCSITFATPPRYPGNVLEKMKVFRQWIFRRWACVQCMVSCPTCANISTPRQTSRCSASTLDYQQWSNKQKHALGTRQ